MKQKTLTSKQEKVLDFVEFYLQKQGFPPTLREIGEAIGLANINAVRGHLLAIEKKGYISKAPDRARSIQVLRSPSTISRLKRKVHEVLKTDEGVIHQIIYGLAWLTHDKAPFLQESAKDLMAAAFDQEIVDRGWELVQKEIRPEYVSLVVKVWPNHSAELVVRRFQEAGLRVKRHYPDLFPGKDLWAQGYIATTTLDSMAKLAEQYFQKQKLQP
jgi:repressor LexA